MTLVLGGVLLSLRIIGIVLLVLLILAGIFLLLPVGLVIRWSQREGAVWQAKVGPLRFPLYPFPESEPLEQTRPSKKKKPKENAGPKAGGKSAPAVTEQKTTADIRAAATPSAPPTAPEPAANSAAKNVSQDRPGRVDKASQPENTAKSAVTPTAPQDPDWGGLLAAGRTLANALWPDRANWLRHVRVRHLEIFWTVTGEDAADTAIRYGAYMAACNTALAVARDHVSIQSDCLRLEPDFAGKQKENRHIACQILSRMYIIILVVRVLSQTDKKTGETPLRTMLQQLGA